MLLSKGGRKMVEMREEWQFLQLRAAQLFEEGEVKKALRLMRTINAAQLCRFEQEDEYEQTENC